jgi:hypothetical protein
MEFWEIMHRCPDLHLDEEAKFCSMCNSPGGVIFWLDWFPLNHVRETYICQDCAPNFIEQRKKEEEIFGEAFEEACKCYN